MVTPSMPDAPGRDHEGSAARAEKPQVLPINPAAVPDELRKATIWLAWRYKWLPPRNGKPGRWTKEPINPKNGRHAKSNDLSTCVSYDHALATYRRWGCDGIGFCRTGNLVLIDLDGVLDEDGNLKPYPWARKILAAIEGRAYIEKSVTGTGLHAVCLGSLPDLGRCQYNEPGQEHTGFAFYTRARYFTFSGAVWPGERPNL